jgi:hypothetical protein
MPSQTFKSDRYLAGTAATMEPADSGKTTPLTIKNFETLG